MIENLLILAVVVFSIILSSKMLNKLGCSGFYLLLPLAANFRLIKLSGISKNYYNILLMCSFIPAVLFLGVSVLSLLGLKLLSVLLLLLAMISLYIGILVISIVYIILPIISAKNFKIISSKYESTTEESNDIVASYDASLSSLLAGILAVFGISWAYFGLPNSTFVAKVDVESEEFEGSFKKAIKMNVKLYLIILLTIILFTLSNI